MTIPLPSNAVAVEFSPDGRWIVSGSLDNSVRVWDSSTGEVQNVLEDHTNSVWSVTFSPDGRQIVSGSEDNSVWVWDSSTGEVQNVLEGHTNLVSSVAFLPDGRRISALEESVGVSNVLLERLTLPYIWEKSVSFTHKHKFTGWLLPPNGGGYLMFVPLDEQLPDAANTFTIPRSFTAAVNFTRSTLGPQWQGCYSS